MRIIGCAILAALALAGEQPPASLQYRHVCTYGSKYGIHPPKVLNKKPATIAMGENEHPYGLGFPVGAVTDTKNRIWIADSGTNSVHMFDPSNGAYREFRRAGDVLFQQPSGIATDRAGRIYVTDAVLGGIYVFFEKGEFDRALISKKDGRVLKSPTAIAIAGNRRTIYVADPPSKAVIAFNQEGEVRGTIPMPEGVTEPGTLNVVGNDLYVLGAMQHGVRIFTATGNPRGEKRWDDILFPSAFAYEPGKALFAVANPRWMVIEVFNEAGNSVGTFGQQGDGVDQMRRVDSLYIDERGYVYVVDSRHGKVLVFAEPGAQ